MARGLSWCEATMQFDGMPNVPKQMPGEYSEPAARPLDNVSGQIGLLQRLHHFRVKSNMLLSRKLLILAAVVGVFSAAFLPRAVLSAPNDAQLLRNQNVHVFLLRGFLNVFSSGMNEIADKLRRRGFRATVDNHLMWSALADNAISEYRAGLAQHIVIMGHSAGAINAIDMANKIGQAGVPVSLVVSFDPILRTTIASNNIKWVVNLYVSDGMGARVYNSANYDTRVENIDLKGQSTGHMTLDKTEALQERAIKYVLQIAKNGPPAAGRPRPSPQPRPDSQAGAFRQQQ